MNQTFPLFSPLMSVFLFAAEPLPFPSGGGKSFLLGGPDDVLESVLGLGDLADLTVTNDETDFGYDVRRLPVSVPEGKLKTDAVLMCPC